MCCSYPCPPYLQQTVHCPCISFGIHSFIHSFIFFLCLSLVFLNSLWSTVSSCIIVLLVLTATSNGSVLFLTYHPRQFSSLRTLFSHQVLFHHFFLETYKRATSFLRYKPLFIIINFLVFLSIPFSSFLFYLQIPVPYLKIETAQVFSVIILFFSIQFTLQKQFYSTEILIPELIFHFMFFYSVILQYPQVFLSTFFCLSYLSTTW